MANASPMAFNACAQIRRHERLEDFLVLTTTTMKVGQIVPQDGGVGGWLYLATPDAFGIWTVVTSQDRVEVRTQRRTGPASWSRVWINSGCKIDLFIPAVSTLNVDPDTGFVIPGVPDPAFSWWFYPHSVQEAWETYPFSFGSDPIDDFPTLAGGGGTQDIGYAPRLNRTLYIAARGSLNVELFVDAALKARIIATDQASIFISPWTHITATNSGITALDPVMSWGSMVSLINP